MIQILSSPLPTKNGCQKETFKSNLFKSFLFTYETDAIIICQQRENQIQILCLRRTNICEIFLAFLLELEYQIYAVQMWVTHGKSYFSCFDKSNGSSHSDIASQISRSELALSKRFKFIYLQCYLFIFIASSDFDHKSFFCVWIKKGCIKIFRLLFVQWRHCFRDKRLQHEKDYILKFNFSKQFLYV